MLLFAIYGTVPAEQWMLHQGRTQKSVLWSLNNKEILMQTWQVSKHIIPASLKDAHFRIKSTTISAMPPLIAGRSSCLSGAGYRRYPSLQIRNIEKVCINPPMEDTVA